MGVRGCGWCPPWASAPSPRACRAARCAPPPRSPVARDPCAQAHVGRDLWRQLATDDRLRGEERQGRVWTSEADVLFGVLLQEVRDVAERLAGGLRHRLLASELLERRLLLGVLLVGHLRAFGLFELMSICTSIGRALVVATLVQSDRRWREVEQSREAFGTRRAKRTRIAALLARRRSRARRLCAAARCCRA